MKKNPENPNLIKLEELDKKLLFELDKDARQPLSQLAGKLRVNRIVAEYRMKQLQKAGVIRGCVAFVDPYTFGLASWKTYFRFQNITKEGEHELIAYIQKMPNLWWVIRTTGAYDLMFCVLAENHFTFFKTLQDFQQRFNTNILEIAITNHINSRWFTRNYLTGGQGDFVADTFTREPLKENIDPIDLQILKLVAADSRQPVVEMARTLGTTARIVSYRLKELEKRKIIVNHRLVLDVNRFGYTHYKVLLSLKDFTQKDVSGLLEFFRSHPNIENCSQSYGPWDMEFEMEVPGHAAFNELMLRLRETFSRIIRKYEYVQIYEELRPENNFLDYMNLSP